MIIKNIMTNNVDFIIDLFEKELCSNNVQYVKVDNEIHFNNFIIRVYSTKEIKNALDNNLNIKNLGVFSDNVISMEIPKEEKTKTKTPQYKKKDIKRASHKVKKLIKK